MEQVLHLFITNNCRHDCKLCCNKLYEISKIPVVTVELLKSVDTVCLTGGEPFGIKPEVLKYFIKMLRQQYTNIKNLYVYASGTELWQYSDDYYDFIQVYKFINGINIAPKDWKDWKAFGELIASPILQNPKSSNRLYVFKEQRPIFDAMGLNLSYINIQVIDRIWTPTFNTSDNEHFCRLPILF